MKNVVGLTVSCFVALSVVVACGQKDDSQKRPVIPVRGASPNKPLGNQPTGNTPRSTPAPANPARSIDPAKPAPAAEEPYSIDESRLSEQPMSASAECALPRELEMSRNESADLSNLVDNQAGTWELEKTEVWSEVENTDTKAKAQLLATGDETPLSAQPNRSVEERVRVTCHTAKALVSTGIEGMPFLRVQIDFPKNIDRKSGDIALFRQDLFIASKEKAKAGMTVYPRAVNAKQSTQISQFSGVLNQSVAVSEDKKSATIMIKTVELLGRGANHKWTTVRKATYKSMGQ